MLRRYTQKFNDGGDVERDPARTAFDILGAGLGFFAGRNQDAPGAGVSLGYQGEIPDYSLVRERVLDASDSSMRPGAAGKRYFSDYRYMPMSDLTGIAGVRQNLFDEANVGPTSLRAQNFARQGIDTANIPALGDRGPTGINTVVGDTFSYANRGVNRGSVDPTTYTMANVTDPTQVQYFADGTIYVPNYGFININDPAAMANFAQTNLPGLDLSGTDPADPADPPSSDDPPDDDPPDDDPPSSDDPPTADPPVTSPNTWGDQAAPGSYTKDIWANNGFLVKDLNGNKFRVATEEEAIERSGGGQSSTPPVSPTDDFETQYGLSRTNADAVLDYMIFGEGDARPEQYPNLEVGAGDWRRVANAMGYTDANGRIIDVVENEGAGGVATKNDDFRFNLNGRAIYTPNKYRNILERDRALVEDTARSLVAGGLEDQTTATIPTAITSTPTLLGYLNAILAFEGHSVSTTPPDGAKAGGLMSLRGGGYLSGSTDGMADQINTTIEGVQPAALSDGEFVVAADVVSHLGNGNSDAGADVLYNMMADVRKARTGTPKQGTQINPNMYLPSRGIA